MQYPDQAVALALALAVYAHAGQTDKAGQPYYHHPIIVARHVHSPEAKIVALLHDVLEDTSVRPETLENLFGPEILEAVEAVTRREGESYMDFVRRAKENPLAREVKLADLAHNMDLSRLPNPTEADLARVEKYRAATKILQEE